MNNWMTGPLATWPIFLIMLLWALACWAGKEIQFAIRKKKIKKENENVTRHGSL